MSAAFPAFSNEAPAARSGAVEAKTERFIAPRIDMLRREDGLVLLVDMPGTTDKGIDLHVEKNVLTLTGRPETEALEGFEPAYKEYRARPYRRVFTMSEEVDIERIEASLKNGVLRLFFPVSETTKPKKIAVRQG